MHLTRELLVHICGLLSVGRDEGLGDSLLDMALDDGSDSGGERSGDMSGDVGAKEQLLDLGRKSLQTVSGLVAAERMGRYGSHTLFIESPSPLAICPFKAVLTSFLVISSKAGRTELWTSALTAISTTLVVFFVNSLEMSFKIFS